MSREGRRPRPTVPIVEGAVTAIAGGALAAFVGSSAHLAVPVGAVGALNGALSGWRGTYPWRRPTGWLAFGLDTTWALPSTLAALGAHAVAALRHDRGDYVIELSRRQGRHVYAGGFRVLRGFVITLGNTVNNVGDSVHTSARRQRLVTDHEDVHVWQARWLGPAYPVLYLGWLVVGGAVGVAVWATRRRDRPLARVVETCAYYLNPFEWWAYSRDGAWPPERIVAGLGWRRPLVRSLASTPRRAGPPATP